MAFDLSNFLTQTEKIVKILAVLLAGAWAYYHYFRGRTYRPRLELSVSGAFGSTTALDHVVAAVRLKNVGLSKVILEQKGTALVVSTSGDIVSAFTRTEWLARGAFPVFLNHGWIEPGETIENKVLFGVAKVDAAILLEFHIFAAGIQWVADEIVDRATVVGLPTKTVN